MNIAKLLFVGVATFTTFFGAGLSKAEDTTSGADSQVMFVLDGSNSMWGQIDGVAKISIAKEVMSDLIGSWDEDIPVGLLAYGHRQKDKCDDIEVVSTPGKIDRGRLTEFVQSISPRGKTPIASSLIAAASSFGTNEGVRQIILVSDGLETCGGDPCNVAFSYNFINPGFDVHVVGFDVNDEETKSLQCIAANSGGQFFRANNANELRDALKNTVSAVKDTVAQAKPEASQFLYAKLCETCERIAPLDVSWNVYKDGKPFYQGLGVIFPTDPVFEAGKYEVAARYLSSHVTGKGEIEFDDDGKQIGELNLNGGSAVLFAYATDDKNLAADPIFYQFYPIADGKVAAEPLTENASSNSATWLPAGRFKAVATHDQVTESAEIEIIAGQETRYSFDMRVGYLQPSAVLTPNGKPLGGHVDYRIFRSEENVNNSYADGINFMLGGSRPEPMKPGKYFVRAMLSYNGPTITVVKVFPIEIKSNEVASPVFDMQAGLLEHTVKSESGLRIFNIDYVRESDGNRAAYFNSGTSNTLALPVSRYFMRIMGKNKEGKNETLETDIFAIEPGKTTTVNVAIP